MIINERTVDIFLEDMDRLGYEHGKDYRMWYQPNDVDYTEEDYDHDLELRRIEFLNQNLIENELFLTLKYT